MLRFFGFASLALGVISPAHAQTVGEICTLSESTNLFLSRDGPDVAVMLEAGAEVIIKDVEGSRWMVQTTDGRLGFVTQARLGSPCIKGATSQAERPRTTSQAQSTVTVSVAESAAALDVARTAAEHPNTVDQEVPLPHRESAPVTSSHVSLHTVQPSAP